MNEWAKRSARGNRHSAMALQSDITERTEPPTRLRLAEARKRGQVPRSADLTTAAVLLAGMVALMLSGSRLADELIRMTASLLSFDLPLPDRAAPAPPLWTALAPVLWALVPFWASIVMAAAVAGVAQVGLPAGGEVIQPRAERLSPAAGLRRLVSGRGPVRAALALAKLAAVALVSFATIRSQLPRIEAASGAGVGEQAAAAGRMLGHLSLRVVGVLAALSAVDWVYQRYQHRRDLMMTRREVAEDLRKMEGDPLVQSRRRRERRRREARSAGRPRAGETGSHGHRVKK